MSLHVRILLSLHIIHIAESSGLWPTVVPLLSCTGILGVMQVTVNRYWSYNDNDLYRNGHLSVLQDVEWVVNFVIFRLKLFSSVCLSLLQHDFHLSVVQNIRVVISSLSFLGR